MPFDGSPQSSGNAIERGVPCRARAVHHRMQESRFEPQGLAERGALGTEPAEIRRVAFVAGDGCPAGAVGRRYDAAADAAIRACRLNARRLCASIHQ
jgi:hypothetical protein